MRKKTVYGLTALLFAALLAAGAFFDLAASRALYNPASTFGQAMEIYGGLPGYVLLFVCPAGLAALACAQLPSPALARRKKAALLAGALLSAALFFASAILVQREFAEAGLPPWYALALALAAALSFIPFLLAAKTKPAAVFHVCVTGITFFICAMAIVAVLKTFWGRQRFFTMDDPLTQFTHWFLPQGKAASDAYKSFPSGHSCTAAALVWITMLPAQFERWRPFKKPLWAFFALYLAVVMLSRIILGRHFISDVSAGAAITLVSFAVVHRIAARAEARVFGQWEHVW
jgi:membrane-associated phospholipid phosphatase